MTDPAKIDAEAEAWAFEAFATVHPHECYETWPERFWQLFHARLPSVTREQMERTLKETAE